MNNSLVGYKVKNTNGNTYMVLAQNEEDTLLFKINGKKQYVVAWMLRETEHIFNDIYVTWAQGHYFDNEDNGERAMIYMQDREMERSGKKQCHFIECGQCQYFDECEKD